MRQFKHKHYYIKYLCNTEVWRSKHSFTLCISKHKPKRIHILECLARLSNGIIKKDNSEIHNAIVLLIIPISEKKYKELSKKLIVSEELSEISYKFYLTTKEKFSSKHKHMKKPSIKAWIYRMWFNTHFNYDKR